MTQTITFEEFERAKFPTYQLKIDFGEKSGVKQSSVVLK